MFSFFTRLTFPTPQLSKSKFFDVSDTKLSKWRDKWLKVIKWPQVTKDKTLLCRRSAHFIRTIARKRSKRSYVGNRHEDIRRVLSKYQMAIKWNFTRVCAAYKINSNSSHFHIGHHKLLKQIYYENIVVSLAINDQKTQHFMQNRYINIRNIQETSIFSLKFRYSTSRTHVKIYEKKEKNHTIFN